MRGAELQELVIESTQRPAQMDPEIKTLALDRRVILAQLIELPPKGVGHPRDQDGSENHNHKETKHPHLDLWNQPAGDTAETTGGIICATHSFVWLIDR